MQSLHCNTFISGRRGRLASEFQQRCNGLSVVIGIPDGGSPNYYKTVISRFSDHAFRIQRGRKFLRREHLALLADLSDGLSFLYRRLRDLGSGLVADDRS